LGIPSRPSSQSSEPPPATHSSRRLISSCRSTARELNAGPITSRDRVQKLKSAGKSRLGSRRGKAIRRSRPRLEQRHHRVVRRGLTTEHDIPIGVRGTERNQRWAGFCHPKVAKSILTPPQLLGRTIPTSRADAIPALRALNLLKERWVDFVLPWGPGGSVGFELGTGNYVAKPESDLDIVVYAKRRMTAEETKSVCNRTMNLPAAIDIRVETPVCGFSLREFASQSLAAILLRAPSGIVLGKDPWVADPSQGKRIETAMSVAFLFPGQGSQVPGMLHALPDHPSIARGLDEVTEALGENVLELDSSAALRSTVSVQLALLASGVAVARALVAEGVAPEAVAGISAGAFAAAEVAGVLNLADGVRLMKLSERRLPESFSTPYLSAFLRAAADCVGPKNAQHTAASGSPRKQKRSPCE
jgi:phosphoribosyl-dephospho-CoA transferase